MQKLSDLAWQVVSHVYDSIIHHPFTQQLKEGTLPSEVFSYYIEQDIMYLYNYARANAAIASRVPPEHFMSFIKHAESAYVSEQEFVHEFFKEEFDICQNNTASMATISYVNYLMSTSAFAPVEVAVAALLPCAWVYREVGNYIAQNSDENNPYSRWIDNYSSDKFNKEVDEFIDMFDSLAAGTTIENQKLMLDAFYISSVYEWHFWNDSYNTKDFDYFIPQQISEEQLLSDLNNFAPKSDENLSDFGYSVPQKISDDMLFSDFNYVPQDVYNEQIYGDI